MDQRKRDAALADEFAAECVRRADRDSRLAAACAAPVRALQDAPEPDQADAPLIQRLLAEQAEFDVAEATLRFVARWAASGEAYMLGADPFASTGGEPSADA